MESVPLAALNGDFPYCRSQAVEAGYNENGWVGVDGSGKGGKASHGKRHASRSSAPYARPTSGRHAAAGYAAAAFRTAASAAGSPGESQGLADALQEAPGRNGERSDEPKQDGVGSAGTGWFGSWRNSIGSLVRWPWSSRDVNRRNTQGEQQGVSDKRPSDGATSSEPAEGANAADAAGDIRDRQAGGRNGKQGNEGAVLTEVELLLRRGTPLSLREFQRLNELLRQHVTPRVTLDDVSGGADGDGLNVSPVDVARAFMRPSMAAFPATKTPPAASVAEEAAEKGVSLRAWTPYQTQLTPATKSRKRSNAQLHEPAPTSVSPWGAVPLISPSAVPHRRRGSIVPSAGGLRNGGTAQSARKILDTLDRMAGALPAAEGFGRAREGRRVSGGIEVRRLKGKEKVDEGESGGEGGENGTRRRENEKQPEQQQQQQGQQRQKQQQQQQEQQEKQQQRGDVLGREKEGEEGGEVRRGGALVDGGKGEDGQGTRRSRHGFRMSVFEVRVRMGLNGFGGFGRVWVGY
ncbi:unnamed protein product [Closterium sp. Yama58-4]|nr:unnamed protein product [Closterium sp. Yama58-4]